MRGFPRRAQSGVILAGALLMLAGSTVATAEPTGRGAQAGARRVAAGELPPTLVANRLRGKDPADLGALTGRVVVLDFWATWCGPCRALMPLLDRLHQEHHDAGLTVLGVSREPQPRIDAYLERTPVGYTIARGVGPTWNNYGIRTLPTVVIIGRDGRVRHMMVGVNRQRAVQLVSMVSRLLDEPAP